MHDDGMVHPLFADPIEDQLVDEASDLPRPEEDTGAEAPRTRFLVAAELRTIADLLDHLDKCVGIIDFRGTIISEDDLVAGTVAQHEDMGYVFFPERGGVVE